MKMPCHGRWNEEDRICCLCSISNKEAYSKCAKAVKKMIRERQKKVDIRNNCAYACTDWDEYQEFKACRLKRGIRCYAVCHPSEKCLKLKGYKKK